MNTTTLPPMHLPNFPTTGLSGNRDNLDQLRASLEALLPPSKVIMLTVLHDEPCPSVESSAECTCEEVDVTVHLYDPRTS